MLRDSWMFVQPIGAAVTDMLSSLFYYPNINLFASSHSHVSSFHREPATIVIVATT